MVINTLSKRWAAAVLCVVLAAAALLAPGCFSINIPPIPVSFTLIHDVSFGPSSGLVPGVPVTNQAIPIGATCAFPSEAILEDLVREEAGEVIADLISFNNVLLTGITLAASQGNFSSLTELRLEVGIVGGEGLTFINLGEATAPEGGFGSSVLLTPPSQIDLLPIIRGGGCGAALLFITGTSPASDVTMDANVDVTVSLTVF